MASTRPRGFILNWKPQAKTLALVKNVQTILNDNADILPLTLRQIFYMLVSNYGFPKEEKAYKRLCNTIGHARRASYIPMEAIRDDGLSRIDPDGWEGEQQFIDTFKAHARRFRYNRQMHQPQYTFVWCEAEGMLPQLANYCDNFGVSVLSSGGFDSITTKHNVAVEASRYPIVEVLHIGDHDPSGVHMCNSLDEDLLAFVDTLGGDVTVTRIAVLPEQIEAMDLPTAPPKQTDRRSFTGLTTQAEAIPPAALRDIVQAELRGRFDMDVLDATIASELAVRRSLTSRLAAI